MLECKIIEDKFVPTSKEMFLRAIRFPIIQNVFVLLNLWNSSVEVFFNQIGFKGTYKSKEIEKSIVPKIWKILMHILMNGLSGKNGGSNTMSKDWLYVI